MATLFVISTPIGNLEDLSPRAIKMLQTVQFIAAEDTRTARNLLNHLGLWPLSQSCELISYFQGNEQSRSAQIIDKLMSGLDGALISEAGTPSISDPGHILIRQAIERGIKIQVIPGANAIITALVGSGLATDRFLFLGFPPRQEKARQELFASLRGEPGTLIFYESPSRIIDTLQEVALYLGESRQVCVARELTKFYEEYIRGTIAEVLSQCQEKSPRGEITLLIAGSTEDPSSLTINLDQEIEQRLQNGQGAKEIAAHLSIATGKSRHALYQLVLLKKQHNKT